MLEQTKSAVDTLKSVGLKRSDFRVHTERIVNGSTFVGYGDVCISLLCSTERAIEVAPVLARHFQVTELSIDGNVRHVSVTNGAPGLKIENI